MKKWISIFLLMLLMMQTLWAGLRIIPLQMYISDKKQQRSTSIMLTSKGMPEAKIFEVSAAKWSQNEKGEDILEPDSSIIINPKNFVLKPDSKQIVRVGFSKMPNLGEKEGTWRIIFSEVPPALSNNTIGFLLNVSVPLFVGKQSPVDLKITPKYEDNGFTVNMKNNADSHIQILEMSLVDENKKEISAIHDMKYLLTKQEYDFKFPQIKSRNTNKILIKTDKSEKPLEFKLKE
ncbi:molecular chaperone [Acinetobacter sp. MB5]|uniref:fimbrial biogenesis chaperone n=1 Tax=Acinetobacter sp. MB5 TaxID=2069438 RepID=UPI000DD0423D|nr:fimbria/pilus periplasmic chaperone [Acinetobacter sp. MB5]